MKIIQGLSNFDKLVGGLVWCLETCTFDVDVDLLFNEGLTIGKKIGLTEKIVTVLQTMKCPHKIEPHQIQGLDFINIFPVVQWLVKMAMETRDAMGDMVRKYAVSQYYRSFPENDNKDYTSVQKEGLQSIRKGYEPKRKYRQQHKVELDRESKVELTLLEYGKIKEGSSAIASDTNVNKSTSTSTSDSTNEEDKSVDKKYEHLLQGMAEEKQTNAKLSIRAVRSVMDSGDLSKASEQYVKLQEKLKTERQMENSPEGLRKAIQVLENRKSVLLSRTENMKSEIEHTKLDERLKSKNTELITLKNELDDLERQKNSIQLEDGDHERLKKMQSLINKNETLKKKESEFRKSCKENMEQMVAQHTRLKKEIDSFKEENNEKLPNSTTSTLNKEQIERLREDLAHKSKIVSDLERKLDQIPSAYELTQYQRRFVELDNQVSAEFSETQKFVILFNTLVDQKSFIEREVSLLESILENIPTIKYANSAAKSNFLDKLSKLLQGVEQSKNTLEKNFKEQDKKRQDANNEFNKLLDEQRQYTLLVRDMKDEMKKNQILVDKMANI